MTLKCGKNKKETLPLCSADEHLKKLLRYYYCRAFEIEPLAQEIAQAPPELLTFKLLPFFPIYY
jgi:hypothetical protein